MPQDVRKCFLCRLRFDQSDTVVKVDRHRVHEMCLKRAVTVVRALNQAEEQP